MTRKLFRALRTQKEGNKQNELEIHGSLGIPLGGQKIVEVTNRASFVYVRLRDTQNEVIQAFNNQVAASYNLPVIVVRDGTRYKVIGVDTARYQNNLNNSSPYLPKHGHSHSFSDSGGADTTFVTSRQIMPMLVYPSAQFTGTNVTIGAHAILDNSRTWKYVGGTGTQSLLSYIPPGGNDAVMVLIYMDAVTGNPGILVGSGSYFSNLLTGTGDVYPYIPIPNPASQIALSAVRLSSGTNAIDWTNLYDVRQWLQTVPTGTTVFSGVDQIGVFVQDEGIPLGTGTTLNFVGDNVVASVSGSVVRVFVTGTAFSGVDQIGMFGQDEGANLGTGTVLNFVGAGVTATLSGTVIQVSIPSPEAATNTNDIYRCDSCGASGWTGTINGAPAGAVVTYTNVSGNKNTLVPTSSSQLGKQRLYNTTRGTNALISTSNGTTTITLTATTPAAWANGDTITTISPTVIPGGGNNAVDIEITSGEFVGKSLVQGYMFFYDSGAAGSRLEIMPFEAYASSKGQPLDTQRAAGVISMSTLVKLTSNVFSLYWQASGAATDIVGIREVAYIK